MWVLRNISTGQLFYLLNEKIKYVVGRFHADLVLKDDSSISRSHALLQVQGATSNTLTLTDSGSKYGTFVRSSNRPTYNKLDPNQPAQLHCGDHVRFGILQSEYKVERVSFVSMSSTLPKEAAKELDDLLHRLGGRVAQKWESDCTHLTMEKVNVTIKFLCALLNDIPTVTLSFWKEILRTAREGRNELPRPERFAPEKCEYLLNKSSCNFVSRPERKSLFAGKTFIFMNNGQLDMYEEVVRMAGGVCKTLNKGLPKPFLVKRNVVVVQYVPSTQSQVSQIVNTISDFLELNSKRMIPEYEIGLAIINCSVEKYCNPAYKILADLMPSSSSLTVDRFNASLSETPRLPGANVATESELELPETDNTNSQRMDNEDEIRTVKNEFCKVGAVIVNDKLDTSGKSQSDTFEDDNNLLNRNVIGTQNEQNNHESNHLVIKRSSNTDSEPEGEELTLHQLKKTSVCEIRSKQTVNQQLPEARDDKLDEREKSQSLSVVDDDNLLNRNVIVTQNEQNNHASSETVRKRSSNTDSETDEEELTLHQLKKRSVCKIGSKQTVNQQPPEARDDKLDEREKSQSLSVVDDDNLLNRNVIATQNEQNNHGSSEAVRKRGSNTDFEPDEEELTLHQLKKRSICEIENKQTANQQPPEARKRGRIAVISDGDSEDEDDVKVGSSSRSQTAKKARTNAKGSTGTSNDFDNVEAALKGTLAGNVDNNKSKDTHPSDQSSSTVAKDQPSETRKSGRIAVINDDDNSCDDLFDFGSDFSLSSPTAKKDKGKDGGSRLHSECPVKECEVVSVNKSLGESRSNGEAGGWKTKEKKPSSSAAPENQHSENRKRGRIAVIRDGDSDDDDDLFDFGSDFRVQSPAGKNSRKIDGDLNDSDKEEALDGNEHNNRPENLKPTQERRSEDNLKSDNPKSVPVPKPLPRTVNTAGWLSCSLNKTDIKPRIHELTIKDEIKSDDESSDDSKSALQKPLSCGFVVKFIPVEKLNNTRSESNESTLSESGNNGKRNFKRFVKKQNYKPQTTVIKCVPYVRGVSS